MMKNSIAFLVLILVPASLVFGQNQCFTNEEAKKAIESISSKSTGTEKLALGKELIKMRQERGKLSAKVMEKLEKNQDLIRQDYLMGEKQLLRVCQIIKENGWLSREAIGDDGFESLKSIITDNKAFELQRQFLPVLSEVAKQGQIGNPLLATLVDNIRIGSGLPQIFGTQATIRNNIIYLYPLLNEEKVDEWRKLYDLPPLIMQIKVLETKYLLPVLKMQRPSGSAQPNNTAKDETKVLGISDSESEVVKVDTRLVNLNVRILTKDLKIPKEVNLTKEDFAIVEDNTEQEIAFFSTVEQPFDLVLLLDFSGSTVAKQDLIKKAAERFVEFARPNDRIAIVVFATETLIASDLTSDKNLLKQKIKDINMNGGSSIWESLKFVYDNILKKESIGRRSAVVLMTDAEDNSKTTSYADAMEIVRSGETTIFTVYLDSRDYGGDYFQKIKQKSQQSLFLLADETGGQLYKANNVKDLNGIYEQIINDLGKVYSLGYEPKNESHDGGWRNLTVNLKTRPDLITKTRKGYYAK
jgi:VWFA-related protein